MPISQPVDFMGEFFSGAEYARNESVQNEKLAQEKQKTQLGNMKIEQIRFEQSQQELDFMRQRNQSKMQATQAREVVDILNDEGLSDEAALKAIYVNQLKYADQAENPMAVIDLATKNYQTGLGNLGKVGEERAKARMQMKKLKLDLEKMEQDMTLEERKTADQEKQTSIKEKKEDRLASEVKKAEPVDVDEKDIEFADTFLSEQPEAQKGGYDDMPESQKEMMKRDLAEEAKRVRQEKPELTTAQAQAEAYERIKGGIGYDDGGFFGGDEPTYSTPSRTTDARPAPSPQASDIPADIQQRFAKEVGSDKTLGKKTGQGYEVFDKSGRKIGYYK